MKNRSSARPNGDAIVPVRPAEPEQAERLAALAHRPGVAGRAVMALWRYSLVGRGPLMPAWTWSAQRRGSDRDGEAPAARPGRAAILIHGTGRACAMTRLAGLLGERGVDRIDIMKLMSRATRTACYRPASRASKPPAGRGPSSSSTQTGKAGSWTALPIVSAAAIGASPRTRWNAILELDGG